ncbi:unnamed protein product [Fraxinus pennsylvanica]|uniref:Uncharacterized protein n=1 Tax=Fraxinus pennsylvanica TaxID=56036 RepID=A0AAD1ZN02_9LAMI|nr:unnamed protein product [Fraxinus pennsylvanica]
MPLSATMVGALLGLGTQMYSNALRKLGMYAAFVGVFPYYRYYRNCIGTKVIAFKKFADPWEHLLGMGLGAVFANQMVKWDAKSQEDLDKLLLKAKQANERRYFDDNED